MYLRPNCILLFILSTINVLAQTDPIDTLDAYLKKLPENAKKVEELALNGHRMARVNPVYALDIGKEAIQLAEKLGLSKYKGKSHNAIGYAYIISGKPDSAIWHYEKAIEIALQEQDSSLQAQAYLNLSTRLRSKGEYERAAELLFDALRIYEARQDSSLMASTLTNIGIFYSIQKNFKESITYYKRVVKIRSDLGQKSRLGNIYNNLAIDNELLGNLDSALFYYDKSLEIRLSNNQLNDVAASYGNLSIFFRKLDKLDTSLYLAREALKISRQIGSKSQESYALRTLAEVSMDLGRYTEALSYLDEGLPLLKATGRVVGLASTYETYYKVKEKLGLYKEAFEDHKIFKMYSDSVKTVRNTSAIKDAEERYEAEIKDKQITQLELEKQTAALALAESKNQSNILIGSLAIITVAAVLLFIFFRQKRRSLAEKELLLKEIHHRVKNNLQVISSLLNLQADSLGSEDAKEAVMEGQHRVKSMALIHQKLYSADDVRGVDLQDYLENLSSELFRAFGVDQEKINWKVKTSGLKLDIDTVIPLGLIINELITNALKYAFKDVEKGLLQIEMNQQGENLNVLIKDNGKGMDEEQIQESNSFGWKMINSLGRKLKAEIAIKNDNGTEVALMLSRFKLVS